MHTTDPQVAPGWGARIQLLLAALVWSFPGILLPARGIHWILSGLPGAALLLAVPAVALGLLKARFVMGGPATAAVLRIRSRADGPVWGFLAPRSWLMIAVMMSAGHALRLSAIPREWLGLLYVAIGTGLLVSSARFWRALVAPRVVRAPEPAEEIVPEAVA